ncbi:MAG: glycosyltransferase 87 family protein [Vulcanimicrobiaceae bacterium]
MGLISGTASVRVGATIWTRRLIAILVLALVALFFARLESVRPLSVVANPPDFRTFYCGAAVAAAGHDPYRAEPLRACEVATAASLGLTFFPHGVIPSPLPGYAFAAFAPLATLPFAAASALWFAMLVAACVATMFLVVDLTRRPLSTVVLALIGSEAIASFETEHLDPIVICAIVAAALAARAERPWLAALGIAGAAFEPHLAVPCAAALFIAMPRARLPLIVVAAALVALAIERIGVMPAFEYVRAVLPAQALSEIVNFSSQYSLTAALARFGVPPDFALRLGELSFAAMTAAGIVVACACARRFHDHAYLVLIPPAFAVLGGVYVHIHQMAIAIPALLLLFTDLPRWRRLLTVACVCLAIPWQIIAEQPDIQHLLSVHVAALPGPAFAAVDDANHLAEDAWRIYEEQTSVTTLGVSIVELAIKLPTWFALAAIAFVAARGSRDAPSPTKT